MTYSFHKKAVAFASSLIRLQFINFFLVGGLGVVLNFIITIILTEFIFGQESYLYAFYIGTLVNITYNFIMYSLFTFKKRSVSHPKKMVFYVYSLFNVWMQITFTKVLVNIFGESLYYVIIFFVVGLLSVLSFLFFKHFVFNEKKKLSPLFNCPSKKEWLILVGIIFAGLILRLYVFFNDGIVFWDGAVYIGMAKYFFSSGQLGLYEVFRPPFFSVILGLFWYLKLDPVVFGKIFVLFISLLSIPLLYFIGKILVNSTTGLFSALFLAFSGVHIYYSTKVLNDNLSLFLILLVFYLLVSKRYYFLAGFLTACAFLTRFTNLLLVGFVGLYLIIDYVRQKEMLKYLRHFNGKKIITHPSSLEFLKSCFNYLFAFFIFTLPYFIFNYAMYKNPFLGIIEGKNIIVLVGKSISESYLYYPLQFFYESIFVLLFFIGVFFIFKKKSLYSDKLGVSLILLFSLFMFFYLSTLARKEMRYMVLILPFVFMFMSVPLATIFPKLKKQIRFFAIAIFCVIVLVQGLAMIHSYEETYRVDIPKSIFEQYYANEGSGFVVASGPQIVAYQDVKPEVIYWTRLGMFEHYDALNASIFYINDCQLFCAKSDDSCIQGKETFINQLKTKYSTNFAEQSGRCSYYVFSKNN